jgi:hypothetical protein
MKRIFMILLAMAMLTPIWGESFAIPRDNNGQYPASIDFTGVDYMEVSQTATGSICKNADITTLQSTTTARPSALFGVYFDSAAVTGTDYIVFRDTYVVNTSGSEIFRIYSSTINSAGLATVGENFVPLPMPVRFNYGICATNSGATFKTRTLFRYLK